MRGRSSPRLCLKRSASGTCSEVPQTPQVVTQSSVSGFPLPMRCQRSRTSATRAPASSGILKYRMENGGPSARTLYGAAPSG